MRALRALALGVALAALAAAQQLVPGAGAASSGGGSNATTVNGASVPTSADVIGTNSSSQFTAQTYVNVLNLWTGTKNSSTVMLGDGTMGTLSSAFSAITSATNTTAAMVVGAGASLNYTSTGTINATTLAGNAETLYARLASPSFTTPALGVATATSINKVAITAPATSATLTIADGKTLTVTGSMTQTVTDGSTVAFGAGGTVLYSGGALGTPSSGVATNLTGTAAGLTAGAVTGFTAGAGTLTGPGTSGVAATLANAETLTNKTLTTPTISGAITGTSSASFGAGASSVKLVANSTGTMSITKNVSSTSDAIMGWNSSALEVGMPSGIILCWTGDANDPVFSTDLCLSRDATGVLDIGGATAKSKTALLQFGNLMMTAAAPTVAASQVGLGSTTAAVANCGAVATACLIINVAGTTRYIPYY